MTKTEQDITDYTAGDSLTIQITVKDDDGLTVDITGSSIEWAMAPSRGGTATLTKTTSGGGISITNASGGVFEVSIDPTDTDGLEGTYYHEAEVTDASGNVSTVTTGYITIEEDTA